VVVVEEDDEEEAPIQLPYTVTVGVPTLDVLSFESTDLAPNRRNRCRAEYMLQAYLTEEL
jgi:hypothetical protein